MFEVQTRAANGALRNFPSLKEAFKAAEEDKTIWKISFSLPNGEHVRMEKERNAWLYVPIIA